MKALDPSFLAPKFARKKNDEYHYFSVQDRAALLNVGQTEMQDSHGPGNPKMQASETRGSETGL